MAKLKVYGWTGTNFSESSRQSRNIIAATSVAEALRLSGTKRSFYNWSGGETRSPKEVAKAMSKPGVMFWQPLNARDDNWNEVPPREGAPVPGSDQK